MTTILNILARTSRSIRRTARHLAARITRKASIKLALTISIPPFVKASLNYDADLSKPENRLPKAANDIHARKTRKRPA